MRQIIISMVMASVLTACTQSKNDSAEKAEVLVPQVQGPIEVPQANQGETVAVTLSNGAEIQLQKYGEKYLFLVEATFNSDSFNRLQESIAKKPMAERSLILKKEIDKIFAKLKSDASAIEMDSVPSIGYFRFLLPYQPNLFESMAKIKLDHAILVEPVLFDRNAIRNLRKLSPSNEELPKREDGRTSDSGYAGLQSIRAIEFTELAQKAIGENAVVNGSSVNVGIVDTGITYNHPAFLSADGTNRILEIKDTTNEGAIYINPSAAFVASVPENSPAEDLVLNAQVLVTPKLPSIPSADAFSDIKDLRIKVDPELKAILLNPKSGAKLGFLVEDSLQASGEEVDFNRNGKLDDKLPVIYLPADANGIEAVYFDPSGTGDFRGAKLISDFNKGGALVNVSAEKVGFAFRKGKLSTADGKSSTDVNVINFVGFDPGNHGTHVAGITLAKRMIANSGGSTIARGVAPEAKLYFNRVCSNNNGCGGSKGIAELAESNVDVINMSIGGLSIYNDGYGVQETLINRLVAQKNIVFMISAGNSGPGKQTVGSPSVARLSLSVGATASRSMIERQYQWPGLGSTQTDAGDDFMLFFSSRGPTAAGGFKPNLSAPGTQLSSIQLNASTNSRAGLDVYWGTSMAAPTATGAYALLLDAIRKYNAVHPENPLETNALVLRNILIESARPFDVTLKDDEKGLLKKGQYTWADQGTGMLDLVKAWQLLFALRDTKPLPSVTLDNKPVELDYQVLASEVNANGLAYNGSENDGGKPKFASGLYLDYSSKATLKKVYIARRLPENLQTLPVTGELHRQLVTTSDRFVLKTVIYGSHTEWIKTGVRDELGCLNSQSNNLELIGEGVVIQTTDGKSSLNSLGSSVLNICLDRQKVEELSPGDHGALIYAYRTDGNVISPVASFVVPVYMNVPHRTLAGSASYQAEDSVASFQVDRHYVMVPKGTSVMKLTLEVPEYKDSCSGVELMAYEASNIKKVFESRSQARIANCGADGAPSSQRVLKVTKVNPTPGMWDIHIFGQYKYRMSNYKIRVDYVTGSTDKASIEGGTDALQGTLHWKIDSASLDVAPSASASHFSLNGLLNSVSSQIKQDQVLPVINPLGVLRSYPKGVKEVTITTGGSKGNDLDLTVMVCPQDATSEADSRCEPKYTSGGATDVESVQFVPQDNFKYAALVTGYDVKNDGQFVSEELLKFDGDLGTVSISGSHPSFNVGYDLKKENSVLLKNELFTSGSYMAVGSLSIRMEDGTVLSEIPLKIK